MYTYMKVCVCERHLYISKIKCRNFSTYYTYIIYLGCVANQSHLANLYFNCLPFFSFTFTQSSLNCWSRLPLFDRTFVEILQARSSRPMCLVRCSSAAVHTHDLPTIGEFVKGLPLETI